MVNDKEKRLSGLTSLSNTFTYFNGFRMPFETSLDDIYNKVWTNGKGYHYVLFKHVTEDPLEAVVLRNGNYQTYAIQHQDKIHIDHYTHYPYASRNYFYKFHASDNYYLSSLCKSLENATNDKKNYVTPSQPFSYSELQYFMIHVLNFYEGNDREVWG